MKGCYISLDVRLMHTGLSPIEAKELVKGILLKYGHFDRDCGDPLDPEVEVEIGEHTGGCSSAFYDQEQEGFH